MKKLVQGREKGLPGTHARPNSDFFLGPVGFTIVLKASNKADSITLFGKVDSLWVL